MSIRLVINNVKSTLFNTLDIDMVSLPSIDGEITVLSERRNIILAIKTGVIYVFAKGKKVERYFIVNGMARFEDGVLNILSNSVLKIDSEFDSTFRSYVDNKDNRPSILRHEKTWEIFVETYSHPIYN